MGVNVRTRALPGEDSGAFTRPQPMPVARTPKPPMDRDTMLIQQRAIASALRSDRNRPMR